MSHKVEQSILVMNFEIFCAQGVKWYLVIFLCVKKKIAKYKGEIFESSDFTHIHRDEWGYSGSASCQIWLKSMVIHNSYKWPKSYTSEWLISENTKVGDIFVFSDFAHIYRVARAHSGSDSNQI